MIGRRLAALLCVLLAHALVGYLLLRASGRPPASAGAEDFTSEPITLYLPPLEPLDEEPQKAPLRTAPATAAASPSATALPAGAVQPGSSAPPALVDWPLEGKKAAARIVAREAEAERIARMFAGPKGTWASLTKRQRSKLNKFRWRPGVLGLEYDDKGNQIYHLSDGCVIVNSGFIACAIGKVAVHGDMFENMREYFDEQRLPETDEGNGTEPEALRPPY
jgi:hypothetical protein